jgi:hypothetical protein
LLPQVEVPPSRQVPVGSGCASGTFTHRPIDVGCAHDLQTLAQAVWQQTPCAQLPDTHSWPLAQNAPFIFRPHEFPVQTLPLLQLASTVQATKHFVPLQANGAQRTASGATQAPEAVHSDDGV